MTTLPLQHQLRHGTIECFLTRLYSNSFKAKFAQSQQKEFNDNLILVNDKDDQIGEVSKLKAHLISEKNKYPHRAFSVFLFNNKNELLIQRRSEQKVTFPLMWSNTCCSHPINNSDENNPADNSGIKSAVIRRMEFELGIRSQITDYHLIGKILYKAKSNAVFEEYELDYVFLMQSDQLPVSAMKKMINNNEVADIKYISKRNLIEDMNKKNPNYYTPWFELIIKRKGDELFNVFPLKTYNRISSIEANSIISFL